MKNCVCFIIFFSICCGWTALGQEKDSVSTTHQQMEKIEAFSQKGKLTRQLHKLIFRNKKANVNTQVQAIRQSDLDYDFEKFQGKIIRNIHIETFDPFGFSIHDSTRFPTKKAEIIGNRMHLKTKPFTVRALLLFKKNQPLDSIQLQESERMLRSQRYIRRVSVKPIAISEASDSVDVQIKVLDSWVWYPNGSLSTSSGRLTLTNRNFGGFGHYFSNQYRTRFKEGRHAFRSQYQVNNISRSYINAGILYDIGLYENYTKQIYVNRSFYSPLTRWAGGATVYQSFVKDSVPNLDGVRRISNFKHNNIDVWGGHSIPLYYRYNNLHKVQTNFITSLRYISRSYSEAPTDEYDPHNFFSDQQLYLATVGLASVNYIQDKYIFHYDIIEDIAVGKTLMLTGGMQRKNKDNRLYLGAKFALGKYTKSGYYGGEVQFGTFFDSRNLEESVFRAEGIYFSKLYHIGKWKLRHFINPEIVLGFNRWDYAMDKITLNGTYGIDGFDSYELRGTKKVLFNFQVQTYAPSEVFGFRFNPFFRSSIGFMGDVDNTFVTKDMYSKIGLGIMITNDYLVFNSFQLSLAYYPNIPGNGKNIIKTNTLRNNSFGLQQFNYGRPELVPYR